MSGRLVPGWTGGGPLQQLTIIVATAAAAPAAAAGAWMLLRLPDGPVWWVPLAVVLGAGAVGVVLAWLLVPLPWPDGGSPGPAYRPQAEMGGRPSLRDAHDATSQITRELQTTREPQTARDPQVTRPVQVVLPVGRPASAGGQWWGRGAPPPAAGAGGGEPAALERPAARDLGQVSEAPRVVQCPRCGAFRVDVGHTPAGYAFRCRVDDHEWRWRPGTAWPATVVASRRRRAP